MQPYSRRPTSAWASGTAAWSRQCNETTVGFGSHSELPRLLFIRWPSSRLQLCSYSAYGVESDLDYRLILTKKWPMFINACRYSGYLKNVGTLPVDFGRFFARVFPQLNTYVFTGIFYMSSLLWVTFRCRCPARNQQTSESETLTPQNRPLATSLHRRSSRMCLGLLLGQEGSIKMPGGLQRSKPLLRSCLRNHP